MNNINQKSASLFTQLMRSLRNLSMLTFFGLVLLAFIVFSNFTYLDQTVRASGSMIATSRTQVIQALDGGMLSALKVHEGQAVKAGQVLAILEPARAQAGFKESRDRLASQRIALIRARGQADGKTPDFTKEIEVYPNFVRAQLKLLHQRQQTLQETLQPLRQALAMAREELLMNETLFNSGDVARVEVLRAKRQVSEMQMKISQAKNQYLQEAVQEVAKLEEDISSSHYKMDERADVLNNTRLLSPVDGVVKVLRVSTVGGVLRAGDEIMQITPVEDAMMMEAKITPTDIGQLKVGMPAAVKIDAYDYGIYGTLVGSLIYLSPDVLVEQGANGQSTSYYRAHIKLSAQQINPKANLILLKLGMTGTVDIQTGSRSVFRYITKPIFKSFSGALNER